MVVTLELRILEQNMQQKREISSGNLITAKQKHKTSSDNHPAKRKTKHKVIALRPKSMKPRKEIK
jgi:hypothetical protein